MSSEAAIADQRVVLKRKRFGQAYEGEVLDLSERLIPRGYERVVLVEVDGAPKRGDEGSDRSCGGADLRRGLQSESESQREKRLSGRGQLHLKNRALLNGIVRKADLGRGETEKFVDRDHLHDNDVGLKEKNDFVRVGWEKRLVRRMNEATHLVPDVWKGHFRDSKPSSSSDATSVRVEAVMSNLRT